MLFVIGMLILFTICVLMTVILVTKVMRSAYEKRFKKNIHRHLDVLPKKMEISKFFFSKFATSKSLNKKYKQLFWSKFPSLLRKNIATNK